MASQLLVILLQSLQGSNAGIDIGLGSLGGLQVTDNVALGCNLCQKVRLRRVDCSGCRCSHRRGGWLRYCE